MAQELKDSLNSGSTTVVSLMEEGMAMEKSSIMIKKAVIRANGFMAKLKVPEHIRGLITESSWVNFKVILWSMEPTHILMKVIMWELS